MTHDDQVDESRAAGRAELLPEEEAVGSDDPEAQARAILAESDERQADRDAAPSTHLEHRSSEEATPPVDPPAGAPPER
jgi:hypothetical protein